MYKSKAFNGYQVAADHQVGIRYITPGWYPLRYKPTSTLTFAKKL
jgi:hypothetical protein